MTTISQAVLNLERSDTGTDASDASNTDPDTDNTDADLEEDEPFDFKPEVSIIRIKNGVIHAKINNIKTLWPNNQYNSVFDKCLQLKYRKVATRNGSHSSIDNVWKIKNILVGNVGYDGIIYFKVSVYLNDYNIEYTLNTYNSKTKQLMTQSDIYIVNIKSFLSSNIYKIGDTIQFRDDGTYCTSQGEIIEILDDNEYKIKYYQLFQPMISDLDNDTWIQAIDIIHKSRIYDPGTDMQYEIDLMDNKSEMIRNLLIKTNNINSINIYNALYDYYSTESQIFCMEIYDSEKMLIHWSSMTYFIITNIFHFLYKKEFDYKINCLINGENHSSLTLYNLRQSDIRTKYKLQHNNIGNIQIDIDEFDGIYYECDWCRTGLRDWDFVYQCNVSPLNRHDICLNCVDTVIRLNKELQIYLDELLKQYLIDDCIKEIVSYVIGKVVHLPQN